MTDLAFEVVWSKIESGAVPTTKIQAGEIQADVLPDPTPEIWNWAVDYWAKRRAAERK